jgi:hypothetical protein
MSSRFQIRIIKETYFDLDSEREANILADMLSERENGYRIADNFTAVYTEVKKLETV